MKAHNAYCSKTGFIVHTCGLVINPSLPRVGASPDGMVKDPSEEGFGLLEIKCPYAHCFATVEAACIDSNFLQPLQMIRLL